jgi:hypothetical protein
LFENNAFVAKTSELFLSKSTITWRTWGINTLLFICFLLILRIRFNSKIKEHKLIVKVAETLTNLHGKRKTNDKAFAESQL